MKRAIFNQIRKLTSGRKHSKKSAKRGNLKPRTLSLEGLENREMFSVSSIGFDGNQLVVRTDNASTSVAVSQVGNMVRVSELGTGKYWDNAASQVASVAFVGGAGNDRFANHITNMPVTAFGNGGNDYLEGYNGNDQLVGGDGNDTLVGYGGNDRIWGGNGTDLIKGMSGNDSLYGEGSHDHIDGGDGNDYLSGGEGDDTLLGGNHNDQLLGGNGQDHLNGQHGIDKMWGGAGNDELVSIDAAFGEYVDSGTGYDTMWIDRVGSYADAVAGVTTNDMVQQVQYFANGADRTLNGDRVADPVDSGTTARFSNAISANDIKGSNPLFSNAGPRMTDIDQGQLRDCYMLAGLGAIAKDNPHALWRNIVNFDDGTYGVRLGNSFYRVDNDLPVYAGTNQLRFAKLGPENSLWIALVEKAFAHYRMGANSYASIGGGWAVEMNRAFGSRSAGERKFNTYTSAAALAYDIAYRSATGQAVTVGFLGNPVGGAPIVGNHMYIVAGHRLNSAGQVISITLRNPWGTDGAGNDGANDGYVTLTPSQLYAQDGRVNWGAV